MPTDDSAKGVGRNFAYMLYIRNISAMISMIYYMSFNVHDKVMRREAIFQPQLTVLNIHIYFSTCCSEHWLQFDVAKITKDIAYRSAYDVSEYFDRIVDIDSVISAFSS